MCLQRASFASVNEAFAHPDKIEFTGLSSFFLGFFKSFNRFAENK